jgi:hypothetical protein
MASAAIHSLASNEVSADRGVRRRRKAERADPPAGGADSFRRIHRLEHFVRQSTNPSVYILDSPSFGT